MGDDRDFKCCFSVFSSLWLSLFMCCLYVRVSPCLQPIHPNGSSSVLLVECTVCVCVCLFFCVYFVHVNVMPLGNACPCFTLLCWQCLNAVVDAYYILSSFPFLLSFAVIMPMLILIVFRYFHSCFSVLILPYILVFFFSICPDSRSLMESSFTPNIRLLVSVPYGSSCVTVCLSVCPLDLQFLYISPKVRGVTHINGVSAPWSTGINSYDDGGGWGGGGVVCV